VRVEEGDVKRSLGIALVGLIVATAACGKKGLDADADGGPLGASAAGGPDVRTQGSQILVDGQIAGTTRFVEELGRLQKIDELFDRLKAQRESFKAANPSKPFPGRATIGVEPATLALVFKSIFQTAAFAGYPNLLVDTGSGRVPVGPIIPGPPGQDLPPRVALHVRMQNDEVTLTEDRDGAMVYERRLDAAPADAELRERVGRATVDHFMRRDMRAHPSIDVVVHADNRLPYARLSAVFTGLADAHERLAGPSDVEGAFVVRMSMR
jgi:hypothetical protein